MTIKCPKCHTKNLSDSKFCKECATPFSSSKNSKESPTKTIEMQAEVLKRGTIFAGRYEIIEVLGEGGMGKVYRIEDKKTKEELALKLIKPEISGDKKTLEWFSNELKLVHKISHRNVGRMFHLDEYNGTHYITMEFIRGEDLKSFLRRSGQLAVSTTIRIAKQICEGLSEAHKCGVIHRDLKPSNIMIDNNGSARIMDFGIALSIKTKDAIGAGLMIGTPDYMSPEQAEALYNELVARSREGYVQPVILAFANTALGKKEEALAQLDRAYEEKDALLVCTLQDFCDLDSYRENPRFKDLLRRMDFPG